MARMTQPTTPAETSPTSADLLHLARAVELSREHMLAGHGGPFGAVIVLGGQVVGEGWNQVTTTHDPTAHAEVVAIRTACQGLNRFSLTGATIYSSCEPCPMCLAAIYWARIGRLVYANSRLDAARIGFDDALLYDEIPLPPCERQLKSIHLPSADAAAVFDLWAAHDGKVHY